LKKIKLLFPLLILFFPSCKETQPVSITAIEGAKIIKMSAKEVEFELNVKIKNPNRFGFNIHKSEFDIKFSDMEIGKAHIEKKVHINANSEIAHSFIISADLSKIVGGGIVGVLMLLQNKKATVNIKGEIVAGKLFYKKKFPVDFNQSISIGK